MNKLKQELFAPELSTQDSSIEQNQSKGAEHVTEISETLCPRKNLPKNTPPKTKNDQISAPIPSTHNSNSSSNSFGTGPVRMISPATPQASVSPVLNVNSVKLR